MHERFAAGCQEQLNENQITILVTHFYGIYEICKHFEVDALDPNFCSLIHAVHNGEKWEVKLNGSVDHLSELEKP